MRRPITDKEITIVRIVAEKKKELDEEEEVIVLRATEKMVPRWFHKYLKVFEKKKSKIMPMRKVWDHGIDLREGFILKRENIPIVKSRERKGARVCEESVEEGVYKCCRLKTLELVKRLNLILG